MKDPAETVKRALRLIQGGLSAKPSKSNGITVADVLRVFPGSKVYLPTADDLSKPDRCRYCDTNSTPKWRRGGKITLRTWPDGRREWACSFCGREAGAV
jgi:hypothetical protein